MEIEIVTFVVKGSVIDRSKSKKEAEVLLSALSLISSPGGLSFSLSVVDMDVRESFERILYDFLPVVLILNVCI